MVHTYSLDFINPGVVSDEAPKIIHPVTGKAQPFNIRRYLYSKVPEDKPNGQKFLSVEPDQAKLGNWVTSTCKHEAYCKDLIKGLPVFIMKDHEDATEAEGSAILKLLTDYGQDRYLTEDWDEENRRVTSSSERFLHEQLTEMETDFDLSDWDDSPLPVEEADPTADAPTKRPLPRDLKDSFDDKSIQTTGTCQTIKGNLREAIASEVPDPDVEDEEARLRRESAAAAQLQQDAVAAKAAAEVAALLKKQQREAAKKRKLEAAEAARAQALRSKIDKDARKAKLEKVREAAQVAAKLALLASASTTNANEHPNPTTSPPTDGGNQANRLNTLAHESTLNGVVTFILRD
jgi:hypothetical protein